MELLVFISYYSSIDSFMASNKQKILRLAKFYLDDFSSTDLRRFEFQLDHVTGDARIDVRFEGLRDIDWSSFYNAYGNK